ncbi:MAG: DUF885 domain-containing protein [Acidimicrobiia bacterium]
MPSALDALIDDFLADEFEESPVLVSSLGAEGLDHLHGRLGEFSADAFARRDQKAATWRNRLASMGDAGLTLDEQIDRDLAVSTLDGRIAMADWAVWRRDPATYLSPALNGIFVLFLHRLLPEPALADAASSRLYEVPSVLDAARANLDPELAAPVFVQRGIGQCRAAVTYARDLVAREVQDDALRSKVAEAGEVAARAFESFATFLEELAPQAAGSFAIGEERYSRLLVERELLGYGAAELREKGRTAYAELDEEMAALASKIEPGARNWRAVVESLNDDHPESPEAMREEYERWTESAREFLHQTDLVTMPYGERCHVVPSPHFQRPILAVASYGAPPAFRDGRTGHFFVPFPPEGTPPDEVQKRLQTNSRASIPTISVHEAYPGHHWHLVTMQLGERKLRKVLRTAYFTEGWALYAERLMREHGFFTDPRHELAHLDARIFRAARIVVDTSLHIGDMDVEEAVEFMRTKASLSEPTARAEVGRYCSWPTQAASYLTGSLEIERIRARYFAEGGTDLKAFNDKIAGSGGLPIALAERAVMA